MRPTNRNRRSLLTFSGLMRPDSMMKDGRTFRCKACRQIVMFFEVSDTSPYLRTASQPPYARGTRKRKTPA
jgi:hypothetical protein